MDVAVIGAGSTYTPELVSGLSDLPLDELALHDIDASRRDVVGGLARRMLEREGFEGRLEVTGELEPALAGADFVLIQIRVGGQAARLRDETQTAQQLGIFGAPSFVTADGELFWGNDRLEAALAWTVKKR